MSAGYTNNVWARQENLENRFEPEKAMTPTYFTVICRSPLSYFLQKLAKAAEEG